MSNEVLSVLTGVFALIVPEMILGVGACVLFLGGAFRADRNLWAAVTLAFLIGAWVAFVAGRPPSAGSAEAVFAGPLYWDQLARLVRIIALAGGMVLVLMSWNEVPDAQAAEYHACLLLIVAGTSLTGLANELITLFLALEIVSIPTYILLYLPRHDDAAQEAAMKYFLLSVFSSALTLFGFSYLYGLAGTTNIPGILDALAGGEPESARLPALVALVMVTAGLCFRIAAVPFHFYAPDVYQGGPTPAAALLAFLSKVAGFVALLRVFGFVWAGHAGDGRALSGWVPILLWILAAVTMSLGNILAILQSNVKRLLAYSSVAHAGYMLIGLSVAYQYRGAGAEATAQDGVAALLYYLVGYASMTVGAFAVLSYLSTPERVVETEDDLSGLGRSHPGVALLMTVFLFSLIGIPFTAGFWGKLFVFLSALGQRGDRAILFRVLALIGVLNAAVGGWYYLRIIARMYLHTPVKPLERPRSLAGLAALWVCAILTIGLGVPPGLGWLHREASRAALAPATAPEQPAQRQDGRSGVE